MSEDDESLTQTQRKLASSVRTKVLHPHIDAGFINRRRCYALLGPSGVRAFEAIRKPGNGHFDELFNDHLLVEAVLAACGASAVPSLGELLAAGPRVDQIFASVEMFAAADGDVYDEARASNKIVLGYESTWTARIEYHTKHFVADTGRLEHEIGGHIALVGRVSAVEDGCVVIRPLVTGAPTYSHPKNAAFGKAAAVGLEWYGYSWHEVFPEDFVEFQKLTSVPRSQTDWVEPMSRCPEQKVKEGLSKLLGEPTAKDWGGEIADVFAGDVHLNGERCTAAFLLKGPAKFREMTPAHLGKNADQIYRLATSPAQVLVVQHNHVVGQAVRATLRAFAVTPHNPRRYCIIDGADTYRILAAYNLL